MPTDKNYSEPKVFLTIEMTPEEYVRLKGQASWIGMSVKDYLAQGCPQRRGC